jgi:hypothetical protein
VTVDARGKRKRVYKAEDYATLYEKLKSLPDAGRCLKPGISFAQLDKQAASLSDTECAKKMSAAKTKLGGTTLFKNQERSHPAGSYPLRFQDHLVLESKADFSTIVRVSRIAHRLASAGFPMIVYDRNDTLHEPSNP